MGNSIIEIMCEYCGAKNPLDEQFCSNCGQSTRMKIVPYTERVEPETNKENNLMQQRLQQEREKKREQAQMEQKIQELQKVRENELLEKIEMPMESLSFGNGEEGADAPLHNEMQRRLDKEREEKLKRKLLKEAQENAVRQFQKEHSHSQAAFIDSINKNAGEDLPSMAELIKRFEKLSYENIEPPISSEDPQQKSDLAEFNILFEEEIHAPRSIHIVDDFFEEESIDRLKAEVLEKKNLSHKEDPDENMRELSDKHPFALNYRKFDEERSLLQKLAEGSSSQTLKSSVVQSAPMQESTDTAKKVKEPAANEDDETAQHRAATGSQVSAVGKSAESKVIPIREELFSHSQISNEALEAEPSINPAERSDSLPKSFKTAGFLEASKNIRPIQNGSSEYEVQEEIPKIGQQSLSIIDDGGANQESFVGQEGDPGNITDERSEKQAMGSNRSEYEWYDRPFTPLKEWEKSSAVVEQESVSTSEPVISSAVGSADPSEGVEPEVFSGIVSEVSSVDESSVSSTAGRTDSSEAVERIQSSAMEPANPSEFLFVVPSDPLHFEEHISIEKDENENTRSNRNENLNSRDTEPEDQAIRDEYYDLLFEGEEKLSEEKIYGVDRRKVERFLGGNDDYYLFKFNRIERKKQIISLNGAGFLLGGIWLLYRKQYLIPMLMYLASIMSIVFFPPAILLMPLICRVIAGCFGNVMYYRYVRKQVEEARFSKKRSTDIDLPENGGRSFKLAAAYMLIGILFTGFVFVTAYYFRPEWIVLLNEQLQNFGLWQIPF